VALDEVAIELVEIEHGILDVAGHLLLENLLAHADGALELAQPFAGVALLDVCFLGEIVAEDDDGEEQRVHDLLCACLEVLDACDHVRGRGALGVARGDAVLEGMREHHVPAARFAFFAYIGLSKDDLQVRVVVVLVKGTPEEGAHDAGSFDGAEGQLEVANHELIVLVAERDVAWGKGVVLLGVELEAVGQVSLSPGCIPSTETYIKRMPLIRRTPSLSLGGAKAPCQEIMSVKLTVSQTFPPSTLYSPVDVEN